MRISDWSSDVCSSDRTRREDRAEGQRVGGFLLEVEIAAVGAEDVGAGLLIFLIESFGRLPREQRLDAGVEPAAGGDAAFGGRCHPVAFVVRGLEIAARRRIEFRSEEHTSELQSLMRISYAVFCLKKKKQTH